MDVFFCDVSLVEAAFGVADDAADAVGGLGGAYGRERGGRVDSLAMAVRDAAVSRLVVDLQLAEMLRCHLQAGAVAVSACLAVSPSRLVGVAVGGS